MVILTYNFLWMCNILCYNRGLITFLIFVTSNFVMICLIQHCTHVIISINQNITKNKIIIGMNVCAIF